MSGDDDDYPYPPSMPPYPPSDYSRGFGGMYPPQGGSRGGWGPPDPYIDQYLDPNQSPNPFAMGGDYFPGGQRASSGRRRPMSHHPPSDSMALTMQHGGAFSPWGYPPGFPYHGYPQPPFHPSPSPQNNSKKSTPPPAEEPKQITDPRVDAIHAMLMDSRKREEQRQQQELNRRIEEERAKKMHALKEEEDKLKRLEILIMKHNNDQLEREKKQEALRKAEEMAKKELELATLEAKKVADEKAKEVKQAAELAKLEAEKEAAKKAAEEKEKHEKELDEIKKKAAEHEAAKKKFEEEAKKLRPGDDMLKPPIRFKDAVGRKFSFPWHICKDWKGMESLIHQAFLHVEPIGKQVAEGHYDLIGPNNEIILPQVWNTMVKPDMSISMHMWPMPEAPPKKGGAKGGGKASADQLQQELAGIMGILGPDKPDKKGKRSSKVRDGHHHRGLPMMPPPPPGMPPGISHILGGHPGPVPPPPPMPNGMMPGGVSVVDTSKGKSKSSKDKKKSSSKGGGLFFSFGGSTAPKRSESKARKKQ